VAANSEVFLKHSEIRVDEEAGFAAVTIVRTGSSTDAVKIQYGIEDLTATEGEDFVGGLHTVTMAPGVKELTVKVEVLDDEAGEGTERFSVSLVSVEGAGLGFPRTSMVSILDDEAPSPRVEEPPLESKYVVEQEALVRGLDHPVRFVFSPVDPSRVYVAEKGGTVRVADLDDGKTTTLLDLRARVNDYGDRGLLDVALHPDFAKNGYVYVFAVIDPSDTAGRTDEARPDGTGNRYAQVLRYTADAETGFTTIKPGSEMVLLGGAGRDLKDISGDGVKDFMKPEFADLPSSERYVNQAAPAQKVVNGIKQDFIKVDSMTHAGGSLAFGPDGKLYVGIGTAPRPTTPTPTPSTSRNSTAFRARSSGWTRSPGSASPTTPSRARAPRSTPTRPRSGNPASATRSRRRSTRTGSSSSPTPAGTCGKRSCKARRAPTSAGPSTKAPTAAFRRLRSSTGSFGRPSSSTRP
jgi:hypothetical protein